MFSLLLPVFAALGTSLSGPEPGGLPGALPAARGPWKALQDGPAARPGELAPPQAGAPTPTARPRWRDVELPVGFTLLLASGEVVSQAASPEGTLIYADGVLRATPRLRLWERPSAERVSGRVVRGAGVPSDQPVAEEGREYLFELEDGAWGYLRLARVGPESVRLEFMGADAERETLVRDPRAIETASTPRAIELSWVGPRPGASYEVWRSAIGQSAPAELLGRVQTPHFVDEGVPPGVPVEYRVQLAQDPLAWGATVRAISVDSPPEWPIAVERGASLDLLSGSVGGERAHLEVAYASESHLNLRPLEGVTLARLAPGGPQVSGWLLPDPGSGEYQSKLLSVQVGEDVAVQFPGHVFARLSFSAGKARSSEGESGVSMRRQLDLEGSRLLPVAPGRVDVRWSGQGPVLGFEPIAADVPMRESVMLVTERELEYSSDTWEEFLVGAPGVRKLHLALPEEVTRGASVGRFRFRHAYPWGVRSLPGEPVRIVFGDVKDPSRRHALLEAGLSDLVHESYGRRMAARGLLESLGADAWPRLREALESDDPELAGAAREILLAADAPRSDNVASVLLAQAQAEGLGEPPAGWLAADVDERAVAVLRSWNDRRVQPEVATILTDWLRVLVRAEPDEGLRRLAVLLLDEITYAPAVDTFTERRGDVPFVLAMPSERPSVEPVDWADAFRAGSLSDAQLALTVEAATDLADPRSALVMLQIARRLSDGARGAAVVSRDDLELALRLCQRGDDEPERTLLEAAEQLVVAPRARLDALRELVDLRVGLAPSRATDGGRPRLDLTQATLGDLVARLEDLKLSGESYVDLFLPAGDYLPLDGESWIDISVPGLRLIGEEGTHIAAGLRVAAVRDVVVVGVSVDSEKTSALTVLDASVSLIDCELRGTDTGIMLQRGVLELHGCDVRRREQGRRSSWSVRLSGAGTQLFARASLLRAGSIFPGTGTFAFLECCVLDGHERPVLQGQDRSRAVARNCLVRGQSSGILNFSDLQLEGVVIDVPSKPLTHTGGRAWLCPQHVIFLEIDDPLGLPRELVTCPLDEGR